MNVLSIYSGMAKDKHENAFMLLRAKEKGANITLITGKSLELKGKGKMVPYENMDGIPIHRLYENIWDMIVFPSRNIKKIIEITKDQKPDLIFCGQELDIKLALILQRHFKVPIVILVEDAMRVYSGEAYTQKLNALLQITGIPSGKKFWPWLCRRVEMVITCHPQPQDVFNRLSKFGAPIKYLPWPTSVPSNLKRVDLKSKRRGVFVGSLYPHKNTEEFALTLPRIVKETSTKEFFVVGSGPHSKIVRALSKTCNSIKYIPQLPRNEALNLIASSYYAHTPVRHGGWGFIGDCWSMGTPLVMTHNDGYVVDKLNALVANDVDELIAKINLLYVKPEIYNELIQKGQAESENRKAEKLGDVLYDLFVQATKK